LNKPSKIKKKLKGIGIGTSSQWNMDGMKT
jgi:hypothetical protein